VIAGTPGYMAPEQVRGERVDGRADLGATLYEMLGGRRPFTGDGTIEVLHGILATDPPDIADVVPNIPPAVAAIVMRLRQKDPAARFQSAADLAWALEQARQRPRATATRGMEAMRPSRWPAERRLAWMAAIAALAILAAGALWPRARDEAVSAAAPLTPFVWPLPDGLALDSPPVPSPDGRRIVFAATSDDGRRHLWLKEGEALHAVVMSGTDDARQPFWKPDGQSVGFFARGMLMKVALDGGAPVELAPAADPRGAAWSHRQGVMPAAAPAEGQRCALPCQHRLPA
jgi:eukaryotic-like serine/threonine-protein kinase